MCLGNVTDTKLRIFKRFKEQKKQTNKKETCKYLSQTYNLSAVGVMGVKSSFFKVEKLSVLFSTGSGLLSC